MQSHRGARALLVPPPLKGRGLGEEGGMATTIPTNMLSSMFQTVYPCVTVLECTSRSIVAQGRQKHLDIGLGQQA